MICMVLRGAEVAPQLPGLQLSGQVFDVSLVAPILAVAVAAVLVLMCWLLWPQRVRVVNAIAASGLVLAGALVPVAAQDLPMESGTFCFAGPPFSCSVQVSRFTVVVWAVALLAALLVVLLSWIPPTASVAGEYLVLVLAATAAVMAVAAARDLLTLLVCLELVTLPVVVLVAFRGLTISAEGAVKLFLLNTVSLGMSVFGAALVFGATGQVHLQAIARVLAGLDAGADSSRLAAATVGLVLLLAVFALKLSLVPLHAWAPDTYAGAPVPVAAFLAVVSKLAGAVGLLLVLGAGFAPVAGRWALPVGLLAAVTMTVGNLVALRQRQVIGLLAWSSIAQAGWVIAPLVAAGEQLREASRASLVYLIAYAGMTLAVFAAVAVVASSRELVGATDQPVSAVPASAGQASQVPAAPVPVVEPEPGWSLQDWRGVGRAHPFTSAVLVLALASLAGLPPGLMGLFAKLAVFSPVVDSGQLWLAVVMALNVVLALAYYLRWAGLLFCRREREQPHLRISLHTGQRWALGLALAAVVTFSAVPTLLYRAVG